VGFPVSVAVVVLILEAGEVVMVNPEHSVVMVVVMEIVVRLELAVIT